MQQEIVSGILGKAGLEYISSFQLVSGPSAFLLFNVRCGFLPIVCGVRTCLVDYNKHYNVITILIV